MKLDSLLVTGLVSVAQAFSSLQIVPGATWTAKGISQHIQAHGAGIIQRDGIYYMIGEDRTDGPTFFAINCFSSENLVDWSFEARLLSLQPTGDLGPNRVVERPKVLFNKHTKQYVMYVHIDDASYTEAKVGLAVSDTVCGTYEYKGSWRPLGQESRDIGLYQEPNGTAYLLTEDRSNGLRINSLTDDYLNVSSSVHTFLEDLEAPAMVKKDGIYYLFASGLTGFYPNDNTYATSTSLSGPWSSWNIFAPKNTRTYASQTTFVLTVGETVIWMGDRWEVYNLKRSPYVWLPLDIQDRNVTMKLYDAWSIDLEEGTWKPSLSSSSFEAEDASLLNAKEVECFLCSGRKAVSGYADYRSVTFHVTSNLSVTTTGRIAYTNGDCAERSAAVVVNGGKQQVVSFLSTGNSYTSLTSTIRLSLRKGKNTIRIQGTGKGNVPDLDRILIST